MADNDEILDRGDEVTSPLDGASRPPRMLSSVDLPLPEGPSSTTSSPR